MLRQRELPEAPQSEANAGVVVAVGAEQGAGDLEETQRLTWRWTKGILESRSRGPRGPIVWCDVYIYIYVI